MRPPPLFIAALSLAEGALAAGCVAPKPGVTPAPVPVSAAAGRPVPARVGGRETRVETTLGNGVRVILEENHAAPVVALQAWVAVGSADDPVELAGAAHFFEHLVARGRGGRESMTRGVSALGGELDTWTSFDETVFALTVAAPYFGAGIDLVASGLAPQPLDPAAVERERKAILEEIRQAEDDPARATAQTLFAAAFGAHPYARPVLGTEATVAALTPQQLAGFFSRAYVAGNVTVVVIGDFDATTARGRIAAAFGSLPRGSRLPARVHVPGRFDPPRVLAVARDVRDTQLALGFRIPSVLDQDVPALDLLAAVLGRGDGARLGLEVVRNRQAATAARAYTFSSRDGGLLVLTATPSPARLEEAARAMLDEALRLGREEIPADEVTRARTLLEGDLARGKETPASYARRLGFFGAVAGALDGESRYLQRLRALTGADLRATAAKYLRVSGLAVGAVLPGTGAGVPAVLARADARLREVVKGAEARADARAARATPPASVEDVARFVLPSGMRVLVLRDGTVPVVSVEAVWRGGLRDEDARSNGISTLLAALLSRGTKTRTASQITGEISEMAGTLSGFAGRSTLGLRAEFLAGQWERGLELVADCLRNPSFSDEEIERERRVQLDRIRAQDEDPGQMALRLFQGTLWKRHPYRLDPLGNADTLSSLSRRKLIDHFRHHYGPESLTVAVVGDVDTARVVAKLGALLGDAPAAAVGLPPVPPEPPRTEAAEVFRFVAKEQAHVVVGYPGVAATDPDRFALEVLARILGGPGGRLALDMRDRRAIALRVDAFSLEGTDPGYFAVYLACGPERLEDAVQGIRVALARVSAEGVTPDEVAEARRALVGAHAIALQRRGALAAALAMGEATGQGWGAYRSYPLEIGKVGPADVQRVARRILDDKHEVVAVVKPPDVTPALRAASGGGRAPAP